MLPGRQQWLLLACSSHNSETQCTYHVDEWGVWRVHVASKPDDWPTFEWSRGVCRTMRISAQRIWLAWSTEDSEQEQVPEHLRTLRRP